MTREALLEFMRSEKYAVQTSVSPGGLPQAAVVGIAVTERFRHAGLVPQGAEPARKSGDCICDWRNARG